MFLHHLGHSTLSRPTPCQQQNLLFGPPRPRSLTTAARQAQKTSSLQRWRDQQWRGCRQAGVVCRAEIIDAEAEDVDPANKSEAKEGEVIDDVVDAEAAEGIAD